MEVKHMRITSGHVRLARTTSALLGIVVWSTTALAASAQVLPTETPPSVPTSAPTSTPPALATIASTATPPAVPTSLPTATPPAAPVAAPTETPPTVPNAD